MIMIYQILIVCLLKSKANEYRNKLHKCSQLIINYAAQFSRLPNETILEGAGGQMYNKI